MKSARARMYVIAAAALCLGGVAAALLLRADGDAGTTQPDVRRGGIVRVVARALDVGPLDPALEYTLASALLVETTCVRPSEVAAPPVRISQNRTTYTFTLRSGFRFSDGAAVRASAFARALNRIIAPGIKSPWAPYFADVAKVTARGQTFVVELARPVPDFVARANILC